MKRRVLILCTGNSARSQMAEGWLRHLAGDRFEVESAGTKPGFVRPEAIAAMAEVGIDLSDHRSKHASEFDGQEFDTVLTVCDHARDVCPAFPGAREMVHHSFEDPSGLDGFRRVRDEIGTYLREFVTR